MCIEIWYILEHADTWIRLSKRKEEEFDARE